MMGFIITRENSCQNVNEHLSLCSIWLDFHGISYKTELKTGNVINHLWDVFVNFQIGNLKGLIFDSK